MSTLRLSQVCIALMASVVLLAACSGPTDELAQWMADVRKEVKPINTRIAEPKKFVPYLYGEQNQLDPFNPVKLANALSKLAARSKSPLAPNLDRRKEPLEAFPLDTVRMVGLLEKPGLRYALLRVDGIVYQVKVGNYVGQNFGIVTDITESGTTLKEVVQDAAGEWVERVSTLQLQETNK